MACVAYLPPPSPLHNPNLNPTRARSYFVPSSTPYPTTPSPPLQHSSIPNILVLYLRDVGIHRYLERYFLHTSHIRLNIASPPHPYSESTPLRLLQLHLLRILLPTPFPHPPRSRIPFILASIWIRQPWPASAVRVTNLSLPWEERVYRDGGERARG